MADEASSQQGESAQTIQVISRLLNVTERRVRQLAKEGHIPAPVGRNRWELVPTVQGYCRYMQQLAAGRGETAGAHAAEVQRQRAEKLKRENLIAEGQLIPKQDLVSSATEVFSHVRARLLAIPTKAAPSLMLLETPAEMKDYLTDEIHGVLQELSETKVVGISEDTERPTSGQSVDRKPKRTKAATTANSKRVGGRRKATKRGK